MLTIKQHFNKKKPRNNNHKTYAREVDLQQIRQQTTTKSKAYKIKTSSNCNKFRVHSILFLHKYFLLGICLTFSIVNLKGQKNGPGFFISLFGYNEVCCCFKAMN